MVLRVGTDEVGSLLCGQSPRGQGSLGVAVGVVQVQAVDVAAPQHRLALHGTGVAEISCKDRDGRAGPREGAESPSLRILQNHPVTILRHALWDSPARARSWEPPQTLPT